MIIWVAVREIFIFMKIHVNSGKLNTDRNQVARYSAVLMSIAMKADVFSYYL